MARVVLQKGLEVLSRGGLKPTDQSEEIQGVCVTNITTLYNESRLTVTVVEGNLRLITAVYTTGS